MGGAENSVLKDVRCAYICPHRPACEGDELYSGSDLKELVMRSAFEQENDLICVVFGESPSVTSVYSD